MKQSYYDVLQVSPRATSDIIDSAYSQLRKKLSAEASNGGEDARNQLLFLEEAYAVLSSPQKREAYDKKNQPDVARSTMNPTYYADDVIQESWSSTFFGRITIAALVLGSCFAAYKFGIERTVQGSADKQVLSSKDRPAIQNDVFRAETERALVQGAIQNQERQIGNSYDIAARESERRRAEFDHRASIEAQRIELQRQRQEVMLEEQRWRQEQREKDRQAKEAKEIADAPKRQLCNMYALNGNTRDARAAGCYKY